MSECNFKRYCYVATFALAASYQLVCSAPGKNHVFYVMAAIKNTQLMEKMLFICNCILLFSYSIIITNNFF